MSTKAERGPEAVIERIAHCVQDAVDECDLSLKQVRGVGIGAPGSVDPENGKVMFAGNLGLEKRAARQRSELGKTNLDIAGVRVHNDCNICALGVHEVELERTSATHGRLSFSGTGIGGGLIIDGKVYGGFNRTAGRGRATWCWKSTGPNVPAATKAAGKRLPAAPRSSARSSRQVKDGAKTVLTDMLGDDLDGLRSGGTCERYQAGR